MLFSTQKSADCVHLLPWSPAMSTVKEPHAEFLSSWWPFQEGEKGHPQTPFPPRAAECGPHSRTARARGQMPAMPSRPRPSPGVATPPPVSRFYELCHLAVFWCPLHYFNSRSVATWCFLLCLLFDLKLTSTLIMYLRFSSGITVGSRTTIAQQENPRKVQGPKK